MAKKIRGFEEVANEHKAYVENVSFHGIRKTFYPDVELPVRADPRSAGYDFFLPIDVILDPNQRLIVWSNVKAYMQDDEVLKIYPRSSHGNKGLMLSTTVGIIDASYYSNPKNDGNIGLALYNTAPRSMVLKRGDRIAQGIFTKYLTADNDEVLKATREGGMGSSGE